MDRRTFLTSAAALAPTLAAPSRARAQASRFALADSYSAQRGGTGLLIMRNGVVLHESYLAPGGADIAYPLGGVSKALASVLAMAMVRDNLLTLDEPVSFTIGDWGLVPAKSAITVKHLLNLTAGLDADRTGATAPTLSEALGAPLQGDPGQVFLYDDAAYTVLAEVAARKLAADGRDPDPAQYLERRVLSQLGAQADWARASDGALWLGSGAAATARSLARLGELIRRDGIWRARRTLSVNALEETFRGSFASPRFGLGWWLADALPPTDPFVSQVSDVWGLDSGVPRDMAMAAGAAGQRLYLIPSRAMVIARVTDGRSAAPVGAWSDATLLRMALSEA